ncbi:peroxiredoxin family protein [Gemmatimonadota bacterium]
MTIPAVISACPSVLLSPSCDILYRNGIRLKKKVGYPAVIRIIKTCSALLPLLLLVVPLYLTSCSDSTSDSTEEEVAIGAKAPEIVGSDVDGNEMKLSDYLGKVIVLDFWGDW